MALQDELRAAQRSLNDLAQCVGRLERQLGSGLEVRRVRSDADHLQESLSLLSATVPGHRSASAAGVPAAEEMIPVPDTPYDHRLWSDADDEGVGVRDRHCP
jgi:hypothetical protein